MVSSAKMDVVNFGDDFFLLGGTSLTAAILCGRVKQKFGVTITVGDVLENATLYKMSKLLSATSSQL